MLELQRIRFTGWTLTEGQHRPKAGKKKKTREAGLFFLVSVGHDQSYTWIGVDRQGFGQVRPIVGAGS